MEFNVNNHVDRLHKFLPFGPSISEIIAELTSEAQKLDIKTKAIDFVIDVLKKKPKLVILTGNAGHGKTYICQKILTDYLNLDRIEALKEIQKNSLAGKGIQNAEGHLSVKIYKDFSEIRDSKTGAKILVDILSDGSSVSNIVCVNEGKLRDVLSYIKVLDPRIHKKITLSLEDCINKGVVSNDGQLFIINLNYQTVVSAADGENFVIQVFQSWIDDDRSWGQCTTCNASEAGCPILLNREMLKVKGSSSIDARKRRQGIIQLFEIAEMSGYVITIREMLMVLAYIITGNITCQEVEKKIRKWPNGGWQHKHSFYNVIYGANLPLSDLKRLPLIKLFKHFDPSNYSRRYVDDKYVLGNQLQTNQSDLKFIGRKKEVHDAVETASGVKVNTVGTETGKEEAELLQQSMSLLRRRDFFDLWGIEDDEKGRELRAKRIGYDCMADMFWLLNSTNNSDTQRLVNIKSQLISGLNAVQGLSPWEAENELYIVHPSFVRLQRKNCLIKAKKTADTIAISEIRQEWKESRDHNYFINESVNWNSREVVFTVEGNEMILDLQHFELLMKAGSGFLSKSILSSDVRRIINYTAKLAEELTSSEGALTVRTPKGIISLTISEGLIQ
jgi:hypothetical protein